MKRKILTLRQIYREGTEVLERAGVPGPSRDAWLLLSHVTGISRASYYGDPERMLTEEECVRYEELIQKRAQRIPLQHLTGEQEFMGYPFRVNEHVLVPRQDTEILAEEALKRLRPGMRILDLCTGSGCVLISLLKAYRERTGAGDGEKPLTGIGTDISAEALKVAEQNARELQAPAEFLQSDLFGNVTGRFDMIVSNPPYIPTKEIGSLQEEVRLYDPHIALDGGEDGLYFYREIIRDSVHYMKEGGCLLLETGCDQGEDVSALMERAGYSGIRVQKDLSGLDRVVGGRL